jgi:hypothetical protein
MPAQSNDVLLCTVFVLISAFAILAVNLPSAQALTIEANAPIVKVKPGGSAVKNILVYGTGADNMQVTDINFGKDSQFFQLGNPLPAKASFDSATGKLKAEIPLIVTLPAEIQTDGEYPFTVIASSGRTSVQSDSHVLVVVIATEKTTDTSQGEIFTILYIVMAAGGAISFIVYKKIASKRS